MDLHLINGFLGSGKTTAIIAATKNLISRGKRIGIVTNDKGRFQVDTAFFQSHHIPTRQVTGGCFRCSYEEFEDMVRQLQDTSSPDTIFAESVGSCVDLVNTVFGPIQKNTSLTVHKTTYSVFCDSRLFSLWLQKVDLPFSDNLNYLFEKQIEETDLLILNKADLLPPNEREHAFNLTRGKYPGKTILMQNSLLPENVNPWLEQLDRYKPDKGVSEFLVDYKQYKGGEREMAWLDQVITLEGSDSTIIQKAVIQLIQSILDLLKANGVLVGHLKFFISDQQQNSKISFSTADLMEKPVSNAWKDQIPQFTGSKLQVMLNGRLAMQAIDFYDLVNQALADFGNSESIKVQIQEGFSYNPDMSLFTP